MKLLVPTDFSKNAQVKITCTHLKGNEFENVLQQYIDANSIDMLAMITYKTK